MMETFVKVMLVLIMIGMCVLILTGAVAGVYALAKVVIGW